MASSTFINPYLSSQFDFVLSEFAFLVECTNGEASQLLQLNQRWIHDGYEQPIQSSSPFDQDNEERATLCVDNQPSAWLFPRWQAPKTSYVFGTSKKSDIVLPEKSRVSKKHFGMYLNPQGVWIVENYSQFGTLVNGDILESVSAIRDVGYQPSLERSRHSLTPGTPNTILAGRFAFIIHSIPHSFIPSTVAGSSVSSLIDASRIGLENMWDYSSTTGTAGSTTEPTRAPTKAFYYLENGLIHVRGSSKVFIALHKRTGNLFVAKVYDELQEEKARLKYEMMLKLKNQRNIIPYLGFVETEVDFKIITSYLDVKPLASLMGGINLELAFLIFKQMASALQSLKENGIEHNDINESTILIEYKADQHMAYLTGFSEFSIAKRHSNSGFQHDLSSLTQVVRSTLSTYKVQPCCDPQLESIMSKALNKQLAAADVCYMLEEIAANYAGLVSETVYH